MSDASPGVVEAQRVIQQQLIDAGIRGVIDPRRVDPPCVLIVPERATFDGMNVGQATTDWALYALAPQPGAQDAMQRLSELAAHTIRAIPQIETAEMTSRAIDGSGDDWPAVLLRFTAVTQWA